MIIDRLNSPHPLTPSPKKREWEPNRLTSAHLSQIGRGAGGEGILQLIANLNTDQCAKLLTEILPTLTLLDPACGSGAFLVAAMKTLIAIYQQVTARTQELLDDSHPSTSLSLEKDPHPLAPSPRLGEGESEENKLENYWAISPELKKRMLEIARELRQKSTPSENILWQALRNRKLDGRKFRRQQPIGTFVVDFFCAAERLVVEIDGKIHESQKDLDRQRQELLESLGLRFVRLSAELVEQDISTALNTIQATFLPPSSKLGEGLGVRALSQAEKEDLGVRAVKEKLTAWIKEAEAHPSLEYYIKKRIITDNLYGVDIMEEATEIAKLRLFLALVASAETVEDLEPLPNIDFNIMAGNSLIGLIRVDGDAFDSLAPLAQAGRGAGGEGKSVQGNLLNALAASDYQQILEDKNKSIALYKKHAFQKQDEHLPQEIRLLQLRDHIDKLNRESQGKLNQLLLAEFSTKLGIKYEEAQLEGKPKKRLLNIADIDALEPFHWGYHFDKVFERGGFDAIIANPPWEVFQTDAKEFFQKYDNLIRKKKIDILTWEKKFDDFIKDSEIAESWLQYCSQFPHVSQYFKKSDHYLNQRSIVNGKNASGKINLYSLFVERCFDILNKNGYCGIILPSSFYSDAGKKQLRQMLFTQSSIGKLFGLSNERFIFESVDHRFKFCLLDFQKGKNTESFLAAFRIDPRESIKKEELKTFLYDKSQCVDINIQTIHSLSPDTLSIIEFKTNIDFQIAKKLSSFPLLEKVDETRWNLKLTTELDKTANSDLFESDYTEINVPMYSGGMINFYNHNYSSPTYYINIEKGKKRLEGKRRLGNKQFDFQDYRIIQRRVARQSDSRTLIVTIIPPNNFCDNSVNYALIQDSKKKELLLICALLSSFILDFQVRSRLNSNITIGLINQLFVPRLQEGDKWFSEIVERAAKLICTTPEFDDLAVEVGLGSHKNSVTDEVERAKLRAELDGIIAHLYGLTEIEFQHILSTFPIVPDPVKLNALNAYRDVERGLIKSKDKV